MRRLAPLARFGRFSPVWPAFALALAVSFAASGALGSPSDVPAAYKKPYLAAVKLQNQGRYAEALAAFEALPAHARTAIVRIHVAACKQRLGRFREAARDLQAIVDDASIDGPTREVAQSDLDDLRAHAPKLALRVTDRSGSLEVSVDGERVSPPAVLTLDPGESRVIARRAGAIVLDRVVVLAPDATVELEIDVPRPVAKGATAPRSASPRDAVSPSIEPWIAPWIAFGAGAVLLGAGAGSFLQARAASDRLADSCNSVAGCDRAEDASIRRWNAATAIAIGAAAVSAGLGVYLLVREPEKPRSPSVAVVSSGLGVFVTGRF